MRNSQNHFGSVFKVIISATPLRITLGGGGTDLPSFYRRHGNGFLVAAAITKYTYISVHDNFDESILLKYSEIERAMSTDEVKHPLFREALKFSGVHNSVEVSSMADIPAGTGLGSSGSFLVGLLNALYMYKHKRTSANDLARDASKIEIEILGEPVGKQDQYVAAFGGIQTYSFRDDESVKVSPLDLSRSIRNQVEGNLLLFYTKLRRSSSAVLRDEQLKIQSVGQSLDENLLETREIGFQTATALTEGNIEAFGKLLTEQWSLKYRRQPSAIHDQVNDWINAGLDAGATGGKLIGAGGGGFLMFYAEDKVLLRQVMHSFGLAEIPFGIDYRGSSILVAP